MLIIVDVLSAKLPEMAAGIFAFNKTLFIEELNIVMPATQEKLIMAPMSNTNNGSIAKQIMPAKPIAESESYLRITIGAINNAIDIIVALTIEDEKLQRYI